jgi:predicted alpha/beta hydrolase family esterase
MTRVFVIHGYGGTPNNGWKPWFVERMKERGYEIHSPQMPDTNHPKADAWVGTIRSLVGEPRADDAFVGHSLGCIAIIRYLESLEPGHAVGRAIFVAGFYEDLGDDYAEIRSFIDHPVDWPAVKAACPSFSVIHSDDDDAVPVWCARNLAEKLGVSLELHSGYGHFSSGDGVTELPLLLEKFE